MQSTLDNENNTNLEASYSTGAHHPGLIQPTNGIGDLQGLDFMDLNWLPLMSSIPDAMVDFQHTWSSLPDFFRLPQDGSMIFRHGSSAGNLHNELRTPHQLSLPSPGPGTHASGVSDNSGPTDSPSTNGEQAASGEFYADGGATRLPKGKTRKQIPGDPPFSRTAADHSVAVEPSYGFKQEESTVEDTNPEMLISSQTYATILNEFIDTCCSERSFFPPFETGIFPSRSQLDRLMRRAVAEFLPSSPLIHNSVLPGESQASWLLCLALASIGSHYEDARPEIKTVLSIQEVLRRAIIRCVRFHAVFPNHR